MVKHLRARHKEVYAKRQVVQDEDKNIQSLSMNSQNQLFSTNFKAKETLNEIKLLNMARKSVIQFASK